MSTHLSAIGRGIGALITAPGVSPRIAMIGQFASLGATGAINLALLILGPAELVTFTAATAPALLVLGAFDLGVNQRFALEGEVRTFLASKFVLLLGASASVVIFGHRVLSESAQVWGVAFAASFLLMTTWSGFLWEARLFRLDAACTIVQGIGITTFSVAGYILLGSATGVVAGQAVANLTMALALVPIVPFLRRSRISKRCLPKERRRRPWIWRLLGPATSGAALNALSNGVFIAGSLVTTDDSFLALLRLSSLCGVATYALVPVGPQHFAHLSGRQQSGYLRLVRRVSLAAWLGVAIAETVNASHDAVDSVAIGIAWGAAVSLFTLRLNSRPLTPSATIPTALVIAGLICMPLWTGSTGLTVLPVWIGLATMEAGNLWLRRRWVHGADESMRIHRPISHEATGKPLR